MKVDEPLRSMLCIGRFQYLHVQLGVWYTQYRPTRTHHCPTNRDRMVKTAVLIRYCRSSNSRLSSYPTVPSYLASLIRFQIHGMHSHVHAVQRQIHNNGRTNVLMPRCVVIINVLGDVVSRGVHLTRMYSSPMFAGLSM